MLCYTSMIRVLFWSCRLMLLGSCSYLQCGPTGMLQSFQWKRKGWNMMRWNRMGWNEILFSYHCLDWWENRAKFSFYSLEILMKKIMNGKNYKVFVLMFIKKGLYLHWASFIQEASGKIQESLARLCAMLFSFLFTCKKTQSRQNLPIKVQLSTSISKRL